ncbi:MAG: archaemetzincin family Zn-dependent metalloprotease [Bacteroidales bacterium]|nr:archaemetzincin family Zn-dependent metalloprotease [Bacteroidales bacterium]
MNLLQITLVSMGYFERNLLESVAKSVGHEYQTIVEIRDAHVDLSIYFDPARKQYNGNKLLKDIELQYAHDDGKTIGLVSVDLFIPILTYIFGQAFLNGRSGIASSYRLSNERYGLPHDNALLTERFTKEVIHELGHAYGLIHCHTPRCVMQSSTYVEDIDQKKISLCTNCRTILNLTT